MSHSSSWRCCLACNETYYWFFISMLFNPTGRNGFIITSDLSNHNDGISFRIIHQQFNRIFGWRTYDWVSSNAYGCGYTQTGLYNLIRAS